MGGKIVKGRDDLLSATRYDGEYGCIVASGTPLKCGLGSHRNGSP
jgi:hypothetical protein